MKARIAATATRATWRSRFLEIARQAEGAPRPQAGGLRLRARMAGFAVLRRSRPAVHGRA